MGFRRSDEVGPTGSRWRLSHQSLLSGCGVPEEVAGSDRRWLYVLLHGDDHLGTGWDVLRMSPRQAGDLLTVLERDLPSHVGYDLLRLLRVRARTEPLSGSPS